MRLTLPWNSAADSAGNDNRIGQRSSMLEYDQPLVWIVLLLLLTGVVMVYSASIGLPDSPKYTNYKNHHFLMRQSMFVVIGLTAGLFAFRVKIEQWQSAAPLLFALSLVLMVLVLIPGIGKGVNGARRWIGFGGFSLQPSEILKLMMIFYAADFTVRKQQYMHKLTKGFLPMAIAAGLCGVGGQVACKPNHLSTTKGSSAKRS